MRFLKKAGQRTFTKTINSVCARPYGFWKKRGKELSQKQLIQFVCVRAVFEKSVAKNFHKNKLFGLRIAARFLKKAGRKLSKKSCNFIGGAAPAKWVNICRGTRQITNFHYVEISGGRGRENRLFAKRKCRALLVYKQSYGCFEMVSPPRKQVHYRKNDKI